MKIVALALVFGACGGAKPAPKPPEHDDAPPIMHREPADDRVTLAKLEPGDRACYVTFVRSDGTSATLPGDFDLCPNGTTDATPLVGKVVRYAARHDKIQAASCQGNPDCTDSESVDLVITIVPAP